jgi:hypothetical protein
MITCAFRPFQDKAVGQSVELPGQRVLPPTRSFAGSGIDDPRTAACRNPDSKRLMRSLWLQMLVYMVQFEYKGGNGPMQNCKTPFISSISSPHMNKRRPSPPRFAVPLKCKVLSKYIHGVVEGIRNSVRVDRLVLEQLLVEQFSHHGPVWIVHRPTLIEQAFPTSE